MGGGLGGKKEGGGPWEADACAPRSSGHEDRVWCADWHPSGDMIASCSGDKSIKVWRKIGTSDPSNSDTAWILAATLSGDHQRTIRYSSNYL